MIHKAVAHLRSGHGKPPYRIRQATEQIDGQIGDDPHVDRACQDTTCHQKRNGQLRIRLSATETHSTTLSKLRLVEEGEIQTASCSAHEAIDTIGHPHPAEQTIISFELIADSHIQAQAIREHTDSMYAV